MIPLHRTLAIKACLGYTKRYEKSFETLTLTGAMVGEALDFLVEGAIIELRKFNGNPIGLDLPIFVELDVAYTEPGVKGDSSSGSVTKTARLETGLEIHLIVCHFHHFVLEAHGIAGRPDLKAAIGRRKRRGAFSAGLMARIGPRQRQRGRRRRSQVEFRFHQVARAEIRRVRIGDIVG